MIFVCKPSEQVSCFPFVYQHFGIFRLIANAFCKSAMILVRVCQHDPANVRELDAMLGQFFAQYLSRRIGLWPDIDKCYGILFYEVDIYVADIKWRRYR